MIASPSGHLSFFYFIVRWPCGRRNICDHLYRSPQDLTIFKNHILQTLDRRTVRRPYGDSMDMWLRHSWEVAIMRGNHQTCRPWLWNCQQLKWVATTQIAMGRSGYIRENDWLWTVLQQELSSKWHANQYAHNKLPLWHSIQTNIRCKPL